MLPLLLILFVIVPIAELAVIIQVGEAIGVWWTIALLIADSVLGSALMRSQGRIAWRRFNEATAAGRIPARETLDGVLVIFGGALLLTPGFISDIFGAILLIPPTRALIRGLFVKRLAGRMVASVAGGPAASAAWAATRRRTNGHYDVEGHAVDVEADRLDRPAR